MTGRRLPRSTFPSASPAAPASPSSSCRTTGPVAGPAARPPRTGVRLAAALLACASLTVGCGAVPGLSGGEDSTDITVMTWAPEDTDATNKPGMPAFASAYARWINANGGLGGRKLRVLTCNDDNSGVGAAKCARRAVKEQAVAVVGSYSQHADSFFPILEGSGIPYIGGYGTTSAEFTSPLSYPVNGGQPVLLAGLGNELAKQCDATVLVRPDTIAGDELPPLLNAGLTTGGHPEATDVRAPEDATAYNSAAQQALDRATADETARGCVVPALGDRTSTYMDSFRRVREEYPEVATGTVLGSVDQTVIDASGGRSGPYEGSYVTSWYPVATDKRWDAMKKVISEQAFTDTRIDTGDAGVQTTWIAYTVFKAVADKIGGGDVSADTVRRTLDSGITIDTGGLTPALRWQFSDKLGSVGFPRLVNANATLQVVREGQLVAARNGFIDVTQTLSNAVT
ncbi:ABC transporter substrate-binding protein [Streptomyces sp. NPDC048290]|uniref:ABC transporter substrate-binding protein n=1 Tax=Streptomyces sp. NPDC048290 TaxID=3155811 RepID=UPI00342B7F3D